MPTTVTEVLLEADASLTAENWYCKGNDSERAWSPACNCTMVAVERVIKSSSLLPLFDTAIHLIQRAIGGREGNDTAAELQNIMTWNDVKGRTFAEVKEVYARAIELSRI